MERILKNLCPKQGGCVVAVALVCLLTSGFPAAAQTDTEQPPPAPAYPADNPVCGWENVETDSRLARVCLQKAGVNAGLAEYAFAEIPLEYDPDEPTLSGTPEEAGLVSRWAMGEAIHQMITVAVEAADGRLPPEDGSQVFEDIGWLSAETQKKLEELRTWGVTTGTDVYGEYSPTWTVTRRQMALFFVRALALIDETTDGAGTPGFTAAETWKDLRDTDAYEIGAPFADVQAGERPPATLSRPFLGSVSLLYDLGITRGAEVTSEGELLYRPYTAVTGGQMAMFVVRLLAHTSIRVSDPQPEQADIALPVVQQEEQTERSFNTSYSPDDVKPGRNVRLDPDPSTRPPRELDYYRYQEETHPNNRVFHEQVGILDGDEILRVSSRFSLQIGDWYWSGPPSLDRRGMMVVVEFRTDPQYIEGRYPMTRVYMCYVGEGEYDYIVPVMLKVGPGVFRMTAGTLLEAGVCDLGDYDLPVPAGGYTENFPCEGTSERVTRLFAEHDVVLPECRT